MEYVAGVDGERLISGGPMPVRPAFEIVHEIADVLDHAWHVPGPEGHALRMLHRDIKPGNFLLTADGLVKVLDLGIARAEFAAREALTEDVSFGTPAYMAPERMRGIEVHQGDVYSLGCVLYALLKGEQFGRSGLSMRPHTQHRNERMDALHEARPDVPVEALTLLAELLAFDPDEQGPAQQHDQAEGGRTIEQDDGHHDETDDRSGEPSGDIEGAAQPPEIGREHGDNLADRHFAGQCRARASHGGVRQESTAEGRGQPVGDGHEVARVSGGRRDQAQAQGRP
jgi:serine/threonine protein kinase